MGFFDFLNTQRDTHTQPITDQAAEDAVKKGKRLSEGVNKPQPDRISMQMNTLRLAVEAAKDVYTPSWIDLYNIYANSMTDSQVNSQYQTAVNKLIASKLVVNRDGEDNEDLTALFRRPWFDKFMEYCYVADLWGYTLLEFGTQDSKNEFTDVKLFPRHNVYPFNRNIIVNQEDQSGFYYGEDTAAYFLFELKEQTDIGLLEMISREVIWKAFARRDWSEHSEKFGKPHLVILTDTEDESEVNKRAAGAANFANNGYFVGDKENDDIQLLESKNSGNAHSIYEQNIRLIDEQISKLMNGQTSSAEEKAHVGAADFHKAVLADWHHSRLRRYSNIINFKLIPFLRIHGYPLADNDQARFVELDEVAIEQENEEQNANEFDENSQAVAKKKRFPW